MAKKLTQKQSEIVEHMYCEVGVSMKNIALYFVETGNPVDESSISRHLKSNGLSRKKGGPLNVQTLPSYESIYTKAHRILDQVKTAVVA